MVICFDSTTEGKNALDALMLTGQFRDISEAISMALVNYQVIQQAVAKGSQLITETTRPAPPQDLRTARVTPPAAKPVAKGPQVPELFFLRPGSLDELNLQSVPDAPEENLAPARWLFGQYNKFLPVKVACRGLLRMLAERPNGVPLTEATETISTEAWVFGDYLYSLDQATGRAREDAFAAAFPTTASKGAVSRIRFANQFIGDLRQAKPSEEQTRETKFNGFPAALKFITSTEGRNPLLTLTRSGADFASIPNPILDGGGQRPEHKLGDEEIRFLLGHIRRCIPEETSAYLAIIDGIQQRANTPDTLDEYLCERFRLVIAAHANEDNQITETFLTTQRTGAISRMVDLGLLGREKSGLHVRYRVTPKGQGFRK